VHGLGQVMSKIDDGASSLSSTNRGSSSLFFQTNHTCNYHDQEVEIKNVVTPIHALKKKCLCTLFYLTMQHMNMLLFT